MCRVHKIRKASSFRYDVFLVGESLEIVEILSQNFYTDNRSKINSTDMRKEREEGALLSSSAGELEVPNRPPRKPMLTRQQQRYIIVPLSIHPKTKRLLWERGYIVWASGGISDIEYSDVCCRFGRISHIFGRNIHFPGIFHAKTIEIDVFLFALFEWENWISFSHPCANISNSIKTTCCDLWKLTRWEWRMCVRKLFRRDPGFLLRGMMREKAPPSLIKPPIQSRRRRI